MWITERSSKLTDILSSLIEIQLTLAGEKELAGQNVDDRSNLKDPYVYG